MTSIELYLLAINSLAQLLGALAHLLAALRRG